MESSLGGGFKDFYFHPYLGKIPNLTNIFQMGWNHQPVLHCLFIPFGKHTPSMQVITCTAWRFIGGKISPGHPTENFCLQAILGSDSLTFHYLKKVMNLYRIRTLSGIPGSMRVPSIESPIFLCFLCSWWPWDALWAPMIFSTYWCSLFKCLIFGGKL